MLDGMKVTIGETNFLLPKLTVGAVRKHWPRFADLQKRAAANSEDTSILPELMSAQVSIIHAALKRNYPDLLVETLEDNLEMGEVSRIFTDLVLFSRVDSKKGSAEGEALSQ